MSQRRKPATAPVPPAPAVVVEAPPAPEPRSGPVPIAIRRLRGDALWTFGQLQAAVLALEKVCAEERENAVALRGLGASWATIGYACGLTPEGARKRFG